MKKAALILCGLVTFGVSFAFDAWSSGVGFAALSYGILALAWWLLREER